MEPENCTMKAMEPKTDAARLIDRHMDLCQKARDIMVAKNHDYRGGTGDPFANFRGSTTFGIHPAVGILLRMQDKQMRIKTFVEKNALMVKGEGIDDAILDIINYAVLLQGMLRGLDNVAQGGNQ